MKSVFLKIKELILSVFIIPEVQYFDLLDEYEDYVNGNDVSERNTLVGTVRSKKQYGINYDYDFYHIPENYVNDPETIEYIALYRSKVIFDNDEPGVKHYGKVVSYEKVKRSDIKELLLSANYDDWYYRFNVASWETLETVVRAREIGPNVFLKTNCFLLKNSRFFNELYVSNNNEFKLHLGLIDITNGVYDGFFVRDSKVRVLRSKIIVLNQKGKICFKINEYKRYPLATLKKISEFIFDTESQT